MVRVEARWQEVEQGMSGRRRPLIAVSGSPVAIMVSRSTRPRAIRPFRVRAGRAAEPNDHEFAELSIPDTTKAEAVNIDEKASPS